MSALLASRRHSRLHSVVDVALACALVVALAAVLVYIVVGSLADGAELHSTNSFKSPNHEEMTHVR